MSKPQAQRRVDEKSAMAKLATLRTSPRKLNLVAQMIRGKSAADALLSLQFCERRIANDVRKTLQSAVANAENNHNLDVDRLVVTHATVGKSFVMKRMHTRGRGRSARIEKPFSNLTIIVSEAVEAAEKKKAPAKKAAAPKKDAAPKAKTTKTTAKKSAKTEEVKG